MQIYICMYIYITGNIQVNVTANKMQQLLNVRRNK